MVSSMNNLSISSLFEEKPWQWGLRGDPFLWQEMIETIGHLPLPASESDFQQLLTNTFESLAGVSILGPQFIYVERYAHGGMSSGQVSVEFWRHTAFPLLKTRYRDTQ